MEKRAPGRPARSAGCVGRQKIIDDIRHALQTDPKLDTSRKSLALAIGVTPALLTYYFPERDDLFEAVAVPVVEACRIKLTGIVNRSDEVGQKLRDVISVLAGLYGKNNKLFEMYREIEQKYPDDYAETETMTSILSEVFTDGIRQTSSFEAIVLQGAVRGMCDLAKRIDVQAGVVGQATTGHTTLTWLEQMYGLFAAATKLVDARPVSHGMAT